MSELTDLESSILAIERKWWATIGGKESAIRESTGLSTARYYQALTRMLDDPRVEAVDPVTVRRLRRVRAARQRTRGARRLSA